MDKNEKSNDKIPNEDKIFIQNINTNVLELYNELENVSSKAKNARLSILKSINVRPRALIRTLQDYIEVYKCQKLKTEVRGVIYSIEDMMPGGETRLFVCHNKKNLLTNLEFVCVAVRMYTYENEKVCSYCVASYSYDTFESLDTLCVVGTKSLDTFTLSAGLSAISFGVAFGAFAGLGIVTGGVGPIIFGSILALLAGTSLIGGAAVTTSAFDTNLEANLRDILEASFIYELVSRGHADLQNGKLFIKHNNEDT